MEDNGGYLPSVPFSPSGVRAGVAIRAREGGPFRIPSAAGGFFTAAQTGGGGGVAGERLRPIGAVRLDLGECIAEPLGAIGGVARHFQEVTEAEGRVHDSFTQGGAILRREVQRAV